jgi:hypothetical protein
MYSTKNADEIGGRFPIAVEVTVALASFRRYHIAVILFEAETLLQEVGAVDVEAGVIRLLRRWR